MATLTLRFGTAVYSEEMWDFIDEMNERLHDSGIEFDECTDKRASCTRRHDISLRDTSNVTREPDERFEFWSLDGLSCRFQGDAAVIEQAKEFTEAAKQRFVHRARVRTSR